jgi:hypothetical protein
VAFRLTVINLGLLAWAFTCSTGEMGWALNGQLHACVVINRMRMKTENFFQVDGDMLSMDMPE